MSSSFAKKLADSDKNTRDKTFHACAKWLRARDELAAMDSKKLWKGLFYSYWHADGRRTQLDVANAMGALTHGLGRNVMMSYVEGFLWTMRREWAGIDHHRMDKYCLLTKRVTHHALRFVGERGWDTDLVRLFAEVLSTSVFGGGKENKSVTIGFKMYLTEIFLDQIEAVTRGESGVEMDEGEDDEDSGAPVPIPSAALATLLAPFVDAMQKEESEVLLKRITNEIFAPLADVERASSGAPRLTPSAMKVVYERAISLGAENGVEDVCREALYELHAMMKKGASKMIKDADARGVDPELDVVVPPSTQEEKKKKKKKHADSDVAVDNAQEKKTKTKKKKKSPSGDDDAGEDEEAAKREKKRRKKEKRLAKEMAALAAENAEAQNRADSAKKSSSASKHGGGKELLNLNGSGAKVVALRAIADRDGAGSPTPSDEGSPSMSPSKRLMWNDQGITFSSPDKRSPINTSRGKRNLKMTPTKTLLRPIHAAKTPTPEGAAVAQKRASSTLGTKSPSRAAAASYF